MQDVQFNEFEKRDFDRAKQLAKLFPGAVLCFATFRRNLTAREKNAIAAFARKGRKRLRTGQQRNPVLVLTGAELFGQFDITFEEAYGPNAERARMTFLGGDIQDICDFTLQTHVGMESYYDWIQKEAERRHRRA